MYDLIGCSVGDVSGGGAFDFGGDFGDFGGLGDFGGGLGDTGDVSWSGGLADASIDQAFEARVESSPAEMPTNSLIDLPPPDVKPPEEKAAQGQAPARQEAPRDPRSLLSRIEGFVVIQDSGERGPAPSPASARSAEVGEGFGEVALAAPTGMSQWVAALPPFQAGAYGSPAGPLDSGLPVAGTGDSWLIGRTETFNPHLGLGNALGTYADSTPSVAGSGLRADSGTAASWGPQYSFDDMSRSTDYSLASAGSMSLGTESVDSGFVAVDPQEAFRASEREHRSAADTSVSGSGHVARAGDSISRIVGSSSPQAVGNFMRANGLTTDHIEIGRNYFVPEDSGAYGNSAAMGQFALNQGNERIAVSGAAAAMAADGMRIGPTIERAQAIGIYSGDTPITLAAVGAYPEMRAPAFSARQTAVDWVSSIVGASRAGNVATGFVDAWLAAPESLLRLPDAVAAIPSGAARLANETVSVATKLWNDPLGTAADTMASAVDGIRSGFNRTVNGNGLAMGSALHAVGTGAVPFGRLGSVEGATLKVVGPEMPSTYVSPEMQQKILWGQRQLKADGTPSNGLIGAHSGEIRNDLSNFAVEVLRNNPDGTASVKLVTQFSDGNVSKIKGSTLFPSTWSEPDILNSIQRAGSPQNAIATRLSDGSTLYQGAVNGVAIEVIKIGNRVTAAYPTGGGFTSLDTFGMTPIPPKP